MDFLISVDTAAYAAQILAMLLVASMFDPWAKGAAVGETVGLGWKVGAAVSYVAKVFTLIVLLFDMQLVLFISDGDGWVGDQAYTLAILNYAAISVLSISLLIAVLHHLGAFRSLVENPSAQAAAPEDDADPEQDTHASA